MSLLKVRARIVVATVAVLPVLAGCGRSGPDGPGAEVLEGASGELAPAGVHVISEDTLITPGESPLVDDPTPTSASTTFPVAPTRIYIIQEGDSLSVIAESFQVTIDEIRRANPDVADIHKIKVGQELVIPGHG